MQGNPYQAKALWWRQQLGSLDTDGSVWVLFCQHQIAYLLYECVGGIFFPKHEEDDVFADRNPAHGGRCILRLVCVPHYSSHLHLMAGKKKQKVSRVLFAFKIIIRRTTVFLPFTPLFCCKGITFSRAHCFGDRELETRHNRFLFGGSCWTSKCSVRNVCLFLLSSQSALLHVGVCCLSSSMVVIERIALQQR